MLHYVWNWRMVGMTRDTMSPGIRCYGVMGQAIVGLGDYQADILGRLAMFPDLVHSVDDVYWMGNAVDGHVPAVRWTMIGTHRGNGIYGAPIGRRVQMWTISHFEIRQEQIAKEWTLHSEVAMLQQIYGTEPLPRRV